LKRVTIAISSYNLLLLSFSNQLLVSLLPGTNSSINSALFDPAYAIPRPHTEAVRTITALFSMKSVNSANAGSDSFLTPVQHIDDT
jgi:hypothetical protein